MGKVLETKQREQAGSDSYNRFEYQAHTIVYQIIGLYDAGGDEVIFCEFHDDFAQSDALDDEVYDFYQVKTKDDGKEWTLAELTKREKDSKGNYKRTFLGRMFENFLVFGDECRRCYFLSNEEFSEEIKLWLAYVEDGKKIKDENAQLYDTIKDRLKSEYGKNLPSNFDDVFDEFVNKTVILKSDLLLAGYDDKVKMAFFKKFEPHNIPINALSVVYESILRDVREKSKAKVATPISKASLMKIKGIRVSQVRENISKHLAIRDSDRDFAAYLATRGIGQERISTLVEVRRDTNVRMTNSDDFAFIQAMGAVVQIIGNYFAEYHQPYRIEEAIAHCKAHYEKHPLHYITITDDIIEVKIYERMQRDGVSKI